MKVRYVINIDTRLEKSRCSVQWCLYKIGKKIRILYISSTLRSYNELFFIIWYGTFTLDDVWWFIWDTQLMFSVVDTAIDSKCHVSKRIERRPWFSKEADSDRRLPFSVSSHIYIYIVTNLVSRRGIREFVRGFRDTGRNSSIVPPRTVQLPWPKHGINEIMSLRRATSFESCLIYSLGFLRDAIRYRRY